MFSVSVAIVSALSLGSHLSMTNPGPSDLLLGEWKGIELYQDENSYDGQTFYLPNKEELIIDKNLIRIYYYPFSKIDEFKLSFNSKKLRYELEDGYTESEYTIINDTLTMSMHFINKTFVKKYVKTNLDKEVIDELDKYGFNPSSLEHEFELDTFHNDLKTGFEHYDSLSFRPFNHIQFLGDTKILINKTIETVFIRGYKTIRFDWQGVEIMFTINHSEGTQHLTLIPNSQCKCTNIHLPYMTVSWADRIRKSIQDELEWD